MAEPLRALLCDVDGVVRRWDDQNAAVTEVERAHGLPPGTMYAVAFEPERLRPAVLGHSTDERWRAETEQVLAARFGADLTRLLLDAWSRPPGRVDTAVVELLAQVAGKVPVALVSNATTRLERDLDLLGVTAAVDVTVVSSARVGHAKPDPAIYRLAAREVGVPLHQCLFVDDTAGHVDAAVGLGMSGHRHVDPFGEPVELRAALTAAFHI